jgi:hypothetical protein
MTSSHLEAPEAAEDPLAESFLDSCRFEADRPADDLVAALLQGGSISSARAFIAALVEGGAAPEGPVHDAWQDFVASERLDPIDLALVRRAEHLFKVWGAQITLALCFGSLAGGYAANRFSALLLGVSRLESDPARRVFETAQFGFDVLGPGGMEPGGRGEQAAQRVRLMHAAVRRLMREAHDASPGEDWISPKGHVFWRTSWGVPINQEDMMGTIMTMSVHALECLKILGVRVSTEDRWAYVYAWLRVGRELGVQESLLPRDLGEAEALWALEQKRQLEQSPAGAELENVLLGALGALLPSRGLRFIPRALVWKLNGPEVARMVGLAPLRAHERLGFGVWFGLERAMSWLEARNRLVRNKFGSAGTVMVQRLDRRELGGKRPVFAIPDSLAGDWALRSAHRPRKR